MKTTTCSTLYIKRLIIASVLLCLISTSALAGQSREPRVVVVVAGNISIRDVANPDLPRMWFMLRSGSAGLMNLRTGRPNKLIEQVLKPGMEAGSLTVGAGAIASGGAEVSRAGNALSEMMGAPVGELYWFRTGNAPGAMEVLHTEIVKMQRVNALASYHARPGALGSALREARIRTAVIGNSDLPDGVHREAVTMAMDDAGIVRYGNVSSQDLVELDPHSAYGMRSNTRTLLRDLDRVLPHCGLVVIDFGDTFRADRYAEFCTDERAMKVRCEAARRLDRFVARVSDRLDFIRDLLIVLSPSPRTFSEVEEERLAPIVMKGPGFTGGLLTSPSTRRAGVVTIGDVAPTILNFLDAKVPAEIVGRPMSVAPRAGTAEALLDMNLAASKQMQRQIAMRGASVVQSILVVLVTAIILLSVPGSVKRIASWAALVPAAAPLGMLYLPIIYTGGLVGSVAVLVALTLGALGLCVLLFKSPLRALVWLCGAIVASLVVDLLRGAPLTASAIAGYNMIEGARYYGIGNELMGTLLGAAFVGLGLTLHRCGKRALAVAVAAVVFAVVFIAIGSPSLGANAGGAAAAAPAMLAALMVLWGWRPGPKIIIIALALAAVAIGALFAMDAARGGASQSHMGRVVGTAASGGLPGVAQVAQRKIALNFMLLSTSVWSKLLGLSIVGSIVAYWIGKSRLGSKLLSSEEGAAAFGCCVATVGAFIFNDSGVVAAATCVVLLWMLLIAKITV